MKSIRVALTTLLASTVALGVGSEDAIAQEASEQVSGAIEEVVVVGSRRRDRSASDSPVPVDVIGGDDFLAHGHSDMDDLVAALVPSYNVAQEPISDAATFIRPATLRSLPPRRHPGSGERQAPSPCCGYRVAWRRYFRRIPRPRFVCHTGHCSGSP